MHTNRIFIAAGVTVAAVSGLVLAASYTGAAEPGPTQVVDHPSCSLRAEHIVGDPAHFLYIYNGTDAPKTFWVKTGTPTNQQVFTHTFYASGEVIAPAVGWVEYPSLGNWIETDEIFTKCPERTTETTTPTPETTVPVPVPVPVPTPAPDVPLVPTSEAPPTTTTTSTAPPQPVRPPTPVVVTSGLPVTG